MTKNKKDLFKTFFEDYSKNVDNASSQFFWKLSDEIILRVLSKHFVSILSPNSIVLDAGGGTGRWIQVLSKLLPSKFVLLDKSVNMLNVARQKKELQELGNRLEIIEGDIQVMKNIKDASIDFLISIYSPISFVENPQLFFGEVYRVLKPKGLAFIMGHSFTNAIASKINNYLADALELENLDSEKMVKWSSSLAPLHVFSKESFKKLASDSKLKTLNTYGIPIFIQPGPEDFDPDNKLKSRVSSKLESDTGFYKTVLDLEMKYNSQESFVNRGMNLMIVAQKE